MGDGPKEGWLSAQLSDQVLPGAGVRWGAVGC